MLYSRLLKQGLPRKLSPLFRQQPLHVRQITTTKRLGAPIQEITETAPANSSFRSPRTNPSVFKRVRRGLSSIVLLLGATGFLYYITDSRAAVHRYIVPPLLRTFVPDAEDAHHLGTKVLKKLYQYGLHPRERHLPSNNEVLATSIFGVPISNPIGISAGLDKNAEIPDVLFDLGAGIVEVGGCTPLPQEGNPRPRVFRVPALKGLVNRYGLNSEGADAMARRLHERLLSFTRKNAVDIQQVLDGNVGVNPGSLSPDRLLLVQIAKNKLTAANDVAAIAKDYEYCVRRLAKYADVIVVNVSSPNTPGLRDLQASGPLTNILTAVVQEASRASQRRNPPKVMVKVSPDEDDSAQIDGIVQAVWNSGVDGVIVGNTTNRRSDLVPPNTPLTLEERRAFHETGGFSGPSMYSRTLNLVTQYRKALDLQSSEQEAKEKKVIFATGGITNGEQASNILKAGASVAMVYTGLVYGGAGTVSRIKGELADANNRKL